MTWNCPYVVSVGSVTNMLTANFLIFNFLGCEEHRQCVLGDRIPHSCIHPPLNHQRLQESPGCCCGDGHHLPLGRKGKDCLHLGSPFQLFERWGSRTYLQLVLEYWPLLLQSACAQKNNCSLNLYCCPFSNGIVANQ